MLSAVLSGFMPCMRIKHLPPLFRVIMKKITVLGSTGSIGQNTLEVIRRHPDQFQIHGLTARGNVELLLAQIKEFRPHYVSIFDPELRETVQMHAGHCQVLSGLEGLVELASQPVDLVLNAVVGAVGLHPLLAALKAGNHVATANKEPLVMAGRYIMEEAGKQGVRILPVDSEHSAIFQCLEGSNRADVRCVHLTASGGPFYRYSPEEMRHISPAQAMSHPTWDMGAKISVDSATLMNKGLEIIEAMWLFGLELEQIRVVIHPQSIVHSLVEFVDGSFLAQLGRADMKLPIAYALNYPSRLKLSDERMDLATIGTLTFDKPDCKTFPCLTLAQEAAREGGTAPAVLNAANEEAVAAFCNAKIPFLAIAEVVERTLSESNFSSAYDLDAVLEADRDARLRAQAHIASTSESTPLC